MQETLRPPERLRQKRDFSLLYKKGKRCQGKYFTLIYLSNEMNFSRIAVVVNKKVGKAVERNKIKRRIRDLFRTNKSLLKKSLDLLFIMKKGSPEITWSELRREYIRVLGAICCRN